MSSEPSPRVSLPPVGRGVALGYVAMLAVAGLLFAGVRSVGESLEAPSLPDAPEVSAAALHASTFWHVLLAIAVIVLASRALGTLFSRYLGQPAVMGEIVAGLLLGPSALGALSPAATAFLVPTDVAPHLGVIAKIGVVLFMFLVGLELDTKLLKGNSHATVTISHASIVTPFVLGTVLALYLYPRYSNDAVSFTTFALFVGVSLSVTAFPVLARILTDRRMQHSALGTTAIACAAIDDVTAWCLLAFVSGVAGEDLGGSVRTLGLLALYLVFMFFVARPALRWLARREDARGRAVSLDVLAVVFAAILLSSVLTEAIGVHALFGAFVVGAVLPHDGRLAEQLRERLEDVVVVLLLPIFFAFTGLRTQIGLVSGAADILVCVGIIAVATLGKFGGTVAAARLSRLSWRESSALGILMNTRGLMELIVLNVGLDMHVLSPTLFTMLVLMALVTTLATSPIFHALVRGLASASPSSPGSDTAPSPS